MSQPHWWTSRSRSSATRRTSLSRPSERTCSRIRHLPVGQVWVRPSGSLSSTCGRTTMSSSLILNCSSSSSRGATRPFDNATARTIPQLQLSANANAACGTHTIRRDTTRSNLCCLPFMLPEFQSAECGLGPLSRSRAPSVTVIAIGHCRALGMHATSRLAPLSRSRAPSVTVIAIGHCRALGMHAISLLGPPSRSRDPY